MDESAVAAGILRDYARLSPLAFAVARCRDHHPRDVLWLAWAACDDALALVEAASAATPRVAWYQMKPLHGEPWYRIHVDNACGYYLRGPHEHNRWWGIQNAGTSHTYTVAQWRRMLRRRVSLRAMLARLGLAGGRRG